MKKSILTTLVILPALAIAQSTAFTVRGKIGALNAPAKAYLLYDSAGVYYRDSAILKNGFFQFKGNINPVSNGTIIIDELGAGMQNAGPGRRFNVYVQPGLITMDSPDSASHAKLGGTKLNNDLERLKQAVKNVTNKPQRDEIMVQFIKDNPGSLVSFDALKNVGGVMPDPVRMETVYNYLSDSLKATPAVVAYYQQLQDLKKTAIGQPAPDFTQADTAGNNVSLHDFKGKYVLLDFWASWCKPCRHENPAVVSAFNKYKNKGFTVLSVSLDAPGAKDKWLKAIHDDGLTGWTHVSDLNFWSNAVAKLYVIQSIPQNFLLDKDGKIIAKNLRGEELGTRLREILGGSN